MKTGFIYKFTNIVTSQVYIGKTYDLLGRIFNYHLKNLEKETHSNIHFQRSWKKYGNENFSIEVIYSNVPEHILSSLEISTIAWYNSFNQEFGFNKTNGGDGVDAGPLTSEHKKKISQYQKGRKKSELHKQNLKIAANKPERIEQLKKLAKEIAQRPEVKKAKSEASSGGNNGMYGKGYKLLGEKNGRFGLRGEECPVFGEKNGMWNKNHSQESRSKIREAKLLKSKEKFNLTEEQFQVYKNFDTKNRQKYLKQLGVK